MTSMNSVSVTGNLTRDPDTRSTNSDKTVTSLRVAVGRRRGREGEDRGAVFVDVDVWGKTGETCATYLTKGSKVGVSGRLEHDQWTETDAEGHESPRQRHYIVADQVEFLSPKKDSE